MPLKISSFGKSDIGLVRKNNEDYWGRLEEKFLFVVADGIGGNQAGEVASKEAVEKLLELVEENYSPQDNYSPDTELEKKLANCIQQVNNSIYRKSLEKSYLYGMGTTLSCLHFIDRGIATLGQVGDSRLYQYRKGKLTRLTNDHTLYEDYRRKGKAFKTKMDERNSHHILTKAIGNRGKVGPEMHTVEVEKGDLFILCTDGLYNMVKEETIEELLEKNMPLEEATESLIHMANAFGGKDNTTIILIKVEGI